MKFKIALIAAAAFMSGWLHADGLSDESLGLSKTSVFDDPVPAEFAYSSVDPKQSGVLPRFWQDAPPNIPHRIDKYTPLSAKLNKCVECHDDPDEIGRKRKGKPTAMPESHYLKNKDEELVMSGQRYFCTLCHVPKADVETLVGNTWRAE